MQNAWWGWSEKIAVAAQALQVGPADLQKQRVPWSSTAHAQPASPLSSLTHSQPLSALILLSTLWSFISLPVPHTPPRLIDIVNIVTHTLSLPLLHQPSWYRRTFLQKVQQKKKTKNSSWYLFIHTSIGSDCFITFPMHASSISVKNQRHSRNILLVVSNIRSKDKRKYLPCKALKIQTFYISVEMWKITTVWYLQLNIEIILTYLICNSQIRLTWLIN